MVPLIHNPIEVRANRWIAALALGAAASVALAEQPRYMYTELQTLGGLNASATAISSNGEFIVGWAEDEFATQFATIWSQEGRVSSLGTLGDWSQALGVNTMGDVVGASLTKEGEHAFFSRGGVMYDLNALLLADPNPPILIEASVISDGGLIAACGYYVRDTMVRGFLLTPDASLESPPRFYWQELGMLPRAENTLPQGMNEKGVVVGESGPQAFLFDHRGLRSLDRAPFSEAHAVNNMGAIVGSFGEIAEWPQAAVWRGVNQRATLRMPQGWISAADDINDAGVIVGWGIDQWRMEYNFQVAIVWMNGNAFDLNQVTELPGDRAMVLSEATALSETGMIVGLVRREGHSFGAYLLTPILD